MFFPYYSDHLTQLQCIHPNLKTTEIYEYKFQMIKFSPSNTQFNLSSKVTQTTLAGVAQWIECKLANRRVTASIPGQVACLGCGSGTQ